MASEQSVSSVSVPQQEQAVSYPVAMPNPPSVEQQPAPMIQTAAKS